MMELVIGSVTILVVLCCSYLLLRNQHRLLGAISNESEMIGENLNHVASAIVGLSELLEEADQVIENISSVPTVGEILQQALQGFIVSKLTPMLPDPLKGVPEELIKAKGNRDVQWQDVGQKQNQKDEQSISQPST